MTDTAQRNLTRQLSRAAVLVDSVDGADDRWWLPYRERQERRRQRESKARRELRELRETLDGMNL